MAGMPEEPMPDEARLERIGAELRALGDERLPADAAARLSARLERELGPAPARRPARRRRWLPYAGLAVPGLAAAVAAIVIVGGGGGTSSPTTPGAQIAAGKVPGTPTTESGKASSSALPQFGVTASSQTAGQAAAVAAFRAQRAVTGAVEAFQQRCLFEGSGPCPMPGSPAAP
jgi:hypothetical protein